MSERIALLTESEYEALRQLVEWARNTRGVGLINTPHALTTRVRRNRRKSSGGSLKHRWCTVVTVHDDHLICRPMDLDPETSSEADFAVAKPYDLRVSPFDTETIPNQDGTLLSYAYADEQSRTVTDTTDDSTEDQVIVPAYVESQTIGMTVDGETTPTFYPGSVILAVNGLSDGTRATYTDANGYEVAIEWMDVNLSGRAWTEDNGS